MLPFPREKAAYPIVLPILQGSVSRDYIAGKILFTSSVIDVREGDEVRAETIRVPPEKQPWLKNWVLESSDEHIKKLLYTLTGSTAIDESREIFIGNVLDIKNKYPAAEFHTCAYSAQLPFHIFNSEQEFKNYVTEQVQLMGDFGIG